MSTKANLVIDQGSTFSTTISLTNDDGDVIDLTGYDGQSQIRKHYTSITSVPFTVTIAPATGQVTLSLTATDTAALASGRYVYDVELITGSTISRVLEGIVTVSPEVTKA